MKKRETFKTLFKNKKVTMKRIVSPRSFMSKIFVQNCDEWVLLAAGSADMNVGGKKVHLKKGESLFIPRKTPHQILKTSAHAETVWYAVYIT